jgi:uncharacterized protein YgbK (DUF1537 family)
MENLILGCIADDFTGASDAASFLRQGGMQTVLCNGIPNEDDSLPEATEACVIALKTRTQETKSAVEDSLKAAEWLRKKGIRHLYVKYCSTFDSTKRGNIGPILDALIERWNQQYTILCPAIPVNGRTVKNGELYVNGVPLDRSPMKDHPLTPMWDSNIKRLMSPQSKYEAVCENQREIINDQRHYYIIPDYENEVDAAEIVECYGDLPILSGSSGILEKFARKLHQGKVENDLAEKEFTGPGLILAGSCSKATLGQIEYFMRIGGTVKHMDPVVLLNNPVCIENIWEFVKKNRGKYILVSSSEAPERVIKNPKLGKEKIAEIIENTFAEIAKRAVREGFTRIIVAGGETSGAVIRKLGFSLFTIGQSIAPGVPILIPLMEKEICLVLKSGNFGQEDFFERVLSMTERSKTNRNS